MTLTELLNGIDLNATLRISDPTEGHWDTTVGQFVEDNLCDIEACSAALALLPNEPILLWGEVGVERLS